MEQVPTEIKQAAAKLQKVKEQSRQPPEWAYQRADGNGLETKAPLLGQFLLDHSKMLYFQQGSKESLYKYNSTGADAGLWTVQTRQNINNAISKKLQSIKNWSSRKLNDTATFILSSVDSIDANRTINGAGDIDKVRFKNGVYSFKNDCMLPHSPDYYFTHGVDYELKTQEQPTPLTDKWLLESVGADGYRLIKQYIGYMFYRTYEVWQQYIILLAEGGNGKSTFFNWLVKVIGADNTSNVSLDNLTNTKNRFSLSPLVGKYLNYDADISKAIIKDPNRFKKETGNDRMDVEEKGKPQYSTRLFAKQFFGANDLPAFNDTSGGFKRRAIIIPFHTINDFKSRYDLEKIYQEIPAFTYKCLRAFWQEKARKQKELAVPEQFQKITDEWSGANNHVIEFVADWCLLKADAREKKVYMYDQYKRFCSQNGYRALSNVQFKKELERIDTEPRIIAKQAKINGRNYQCYLNVELRPADEIEADQLRN